MHLIDSRQDEHAHARGCVIDVDGLSQFSNRRNQDLTACQNERVEKLWGVEAISCGLFQS